MIESHVPERQGKEQADLNQQVAHQPKLQNQGPDHPKDHADHGEQGTGTIFLLAESGSEWSGRMIRATLPFLNCCSNSAKVAVTGSPVIPSGSKVTPTTNVALEL
jgi:hypothetical protein